MHRVLGRSLNIFLVNFFLMGWITGYPGQIGLIHKKPGWVMSQPVFASGQKNRVRVRYFSGWVGSGQKILTRIAMSTLNH